MQPEHYVFAAVFVVSIAAASFATFNPKAVEELFTYLMQDAAPAPEPTPVYWLICYIDDYLGLHNVRFEGRHPYEWLQQQGEDVHLVNYWQLTAEDWEALKHVRTRREIAR